MYILIAILAVYSVLLTYIVCQLKTSIDLCNKKFSLLNEVCKTRDELQNSVNANVLKMIKSINVDIAKINEKIDEVNEDLLNHSQYHKDLDEGLATTKDQLQELQGRVDTMIILNRKPEPAEWTRITCDTSNKAFIDDNGEIQYPKIGGQEKIAKWVNEHPTDIDFEKDVDEH